LIFFIHSLELLGLDDLELRVDDLSKHESLHLDGTGLLLLGLLLLNQGLSNDEGLLQGLLLLLLRVVDQGVVLLVDLDALSNEQDVVVVLPIPREGVEIEAVAEDDDPLHDADLLGGSEEFGPEEVRDDHLDGLPNDDGVEDLGDSDLVCQGLLGNHGGVDGPESGVALVDQHHVPGVQHEEGHCGEAVQEVVHLAVVDGGDGHAEEGRSQPSVPPDSCIDGLQSVFGVELAENEVDGGPHDDEENGGREQHSSKHDILRIRSGSTSDGAVGERLFRSLLLGHVVAEQADHNHQRRENPQGRSQTESSRRGHVGSVDFVRVRIELH